MLDSRGKQLRAGDKIVVGSANRVTYGTLVHDPDDIRYVRLHVMVDGVKKYFDKNSRRTLNLTVLFQEELDKPFVGVLH